MNELDSLRKQFKKRRVLEISEIMRLLATTSRSTAYRHLKQLNYLSSYSHNGKFYILRELAKFNKEGLYRLGDIGFSKHGTLADTITHIVENSEAGKTSSELEHQFHIRVKNTLLNLIKTKQISREKWEGKLFVYLSAERGKRQQQLKKRRGESRKAMPEWLVLEVLVEIIRASIEVVDVRIIASRLLKRGSLISQAQVQQVLETYDLEKKLRIPSFRAAECFTQSNDPGNQCTKSFPYKPNDPSGVGTNRLLWPAPSHAKDKRAKRNHAEHW